jgi:hypothetical protein
MQLRVNESINLYVVTFDRNLQEDLKSKADTDFDHVPGNGGKKPVVKPRAPTEAVPIGRKGQPRNNNEVQVFRTRGSDRFTYTRYPRTKVRELRDREK